MLVIPQLIDEVLFEEFGAVVTFGRTLSISVREDPQSASVTACSSVRQDADVLSPYRDVVSAVVSLV